MGCTDVIAGIDHVVILVADLATAQLDYTTLGFTVVPGGEHVGGLTHNALIAFADGTYLELLAFRRDPADVDPATVNALTRRWLGRRAAGEGLLDCALRPTAIAADVAAAATRGLALDGPVPGGRRRPDGQEVAWELAIPETSDLPFLCGDVTSRDLRVPGGTAREHANGVIGVAGLTIAVGDLAVATGLYAALLGRPASAVGAGATDFPLAGATIHLQRQEHGLGTPLRSGPVRLALCVPEAGPSGVLDPVAAHGADIVLTPGTVSPA